MPRTIAGAVVFLLLACSPAEDPPPEYPVAGVTFNGADPSCDNGGRLTVYGTNPNVTAFECYWSGCCWWEGALVSSLTLHYSWQGSYWLRDGVDAGSATCGQ